MENAEKIISEFERWIGWMDEDCPQIAIDALALMKELNKTRTEIVRETVDNFILMYKGKKIVQCKDCENRGTSDCPIEDLCTGWLPSDEWFCADGERRRDT